MKKEIITDYDKLSERSEEVNTRKEGDLFRAIILDLKDTLLDEEYPALSAVQIGIPKRVFTINFNKRRKVFVNPFITKCEQFMFSREKTPCLPDREFIVPRYGKIEATYQDPMGKIQTAKFIGASAFVFQQMVDSLEGIMPCDIGLEIDEEWDKASEDEKAELLKAFAESLDLKVKELGDEIANDPKLKQMDDGIKFLNAVQKGEVKLEKYELSEDEVEQLKKRQEEEFKTDEPDTN